MTSQLNYKGTLQLVNIDPRGISYQADTVAQNPIGCITRLNGNLYRYVQFSTGTDAVASVAGAPCFYFPNTTDNLMDTDLENNTMRVTSDYSSSLAVFAGVLLAAAITTLTYIWIQIAGVFTVVVDSGAAKGDKIFANADATFTHVDQGTGAFYEVQGVCLEDRSATTANKASALIFPKQVW